MVERKERLDGTVSEFACEPLLLEPGRRAVLRYTSDRQVALAGTDIVLPAGTVTLGHYWTDRPYNVYHWVTDRRTVALYLSIADRTTITPDLVRYRDLVVDVVLRPAGGIEILDEADLPVDLDPEGRRSIAQGLEAAVTGARVLRIEIERESARLR